MVTDVEAVQTRLSRQQVIADLAQLMLRMLECTPHMTMKTSVIDKAIRFAPSCDDCIKM